jgi:hypothetical protein
MVDSSDAIPNPHDVERRLMVTAGFGVHIAAGQVSLINAAILVAAAWFTHQAVSPLAVSRPQP